MNRKKEQMTNPKKVPSNCKGVFMETKDKKKELEKKFEEERRKLNELLENGLEMTDQEVLEQGRRMDELLNKMMD